MPTSAERLFDQLVSESDLQSLVGMPEDADFDCKVWSTRTDANRGSVVKAACGFTNATGGVIVVGIRAAGRGLETPDVVQELVPVDNPGAVASESLDIIHKLVEPGIEGIRTRIVSANRSANYGFVILYVPPSDGSPRRSKIDRHFYVRVASGTLPMEYFQIEERFGKRPLPKLEVHIEPQPIVERHAIISNPLRLLRFGLTNAGRGIAKFPGIRFKRAKNLTNDNMGVDGNGGFGLPPRPSEPQWIVFRGGVDDVIYPRETRIIGNLIQNAVNQGDRGVGPPRRLFIGMSSPIGSLSVRD